MQGCKEMLYVFILSLLALSSFTCRIQFLRKNEWKHLIIKHRVETIKTRGRLVFDKGRLWFTAAGTLLRRTDLH